MLDLKNYHRDLRACVFVGLIFALFNCCVGAQESSDQVQVATQPFFPKSDSDWKRLTPASAGWDKAALKDLLRYAGEQKSSA